jgi:eukaryotic-like serine/threonine-protein kinase
MHEQTVLAGSRFELRRRLGQGGMGEVFEAWDHERSATVALKLLSQVSAGGILRFKREFRALADVSHPNLVTLYEFVADGDRWFFTMELLDGQDVHSYLVGANSLLELGTNTTRTSVAPEHADSLVGPLRADPRSLGEQVQVPGPVAVDYQRVRRAMAELARGVLALHDGGHLHRDIKPSNVIVTADERVVLLDFGVIAETAAQRHHEPQRVAGTPAYMAPEQVRGEALPASDWYAVGVMLYHVLTGLRPFRGDPEQILQTKQHADAPPPRTYRSGIPTDLEQLCCDLLQRDPARRPSGREVLERLGYGGPATETTWMSSGATTDEGSQSGLVGRSSALAQLRALFAECIDGATRLVLVSGTSGMGKSELVRELVREVRERGDTVVLEGRCYERESLPFKAVDPIVDHLSQYLASQPPALVDSYMPRDGVVLAQAFPVLRRIAQFQDAARRRGAAADPHDLRRRAFAALRDLLGRIAERAVVLIFIDDLQWGDADSAPLLDVLLRPPDAPSLMLVATYRAEEEQKSDLVRAMLAAGARPHNPVPVRKIELGPLSERQARELATTLLAEHGAPVAAAGVIARESRGSPFFVHELVRYVAAAGTVDPEELTLETVMRSRLGLLPPLCRRLLELIALAGRPIPAAMAAQAAALSGTDALDAVQRLRAGHFARTSTEDTLIECYHDRIREVVAAMLTPEARRIGFAGLAAALEATRPDAWEALLEYHEGAGNRERAAQCAVHAAAQARDALAVDRAAALLERALQLGEFSAAERFAMHSQRGELLQAAGQAPQAAEAYLCAADLGTGTAAIELRRRAAEQLLQSGHVARGEAVLSGVLASLGLALPKTPLRGILPMLYWRARLRWRGLDYQLRPDGEVGLDQTLVADVFSTVVTGFGIVDPARAASFSPRYLLAALALGDPLRLLRAAAIEAKLLCNLGPAGVQRAERLLALGDEVAVQSDQMLLGLFAKVARGVAAFSQNRYVLCSELCESALASQAEDVVMAERIARGGLVWELGAAAIFSGISSYMLGDLARMREQIPGRVREAEERGDLNVATHLRIMGSAVLHMDAGNPQAALEEVDDALGPWLAADFGGPHLFAILKRVEALCLLGSGREALDHCRQIIPALRRSLMDRARTARTAWLYWYGNALVAAAVDGAPDSAALLAEADRLGRQLVRKGQPRWGRPPFHLDRGHGAFVRANVAAARGRAEQTRYWLSTARDAYLALDCHLFGMAAQRRLGLMIGGSEGQALVAEADRQLSERGVLRPEYLTSAYHPGFRRRP